MDKVNKLQNEIGIEFNDSDLLKEALTHRSFLNENPEWPVDHNERFEFLGDAVLELVTTQLLFDKFPEADEGRLTSVRAALVNHNMLSRVAQDLGLENYVFLSRGESQGDKRAREAIMANAVEAIIGAIYIDHDYKTAKEFIQEYISSNLSEVMEEELYRDSKSLLQEIVQEKQDITPHYEVIKEEGPDHKKEFTVGVYFDDKLIAEGQGKSKQEAEREAASEALKIVEDQ